MYLVYVLRVYTMTHKSSFSPFTFFFRQQLLLVLDNQLLVQTDQSYNQSQELFNLMGTPVKWLQMSMDPVQHSIPSLHSLLVSRGVLAISLRWKLFRVLMNVFLTHQSLLTRLHQLHCLPRRRAGMSFL